MRPLKAFSNAVRVFNNLWSRLASYVLIALTVVMLVSIFLQVLTRIVRISVIWTSDLATFAFVWIAFIGAAVAVKENDHFIVDIFPKKMKTRGFLTFLTLLALALQFIVGFVMLRYGMEFTQSMSLRLSYALGIRLSLVSAVLPVSGLLILVGSLERLLYLKESIEDELTGGGELV